MSHQPVFQNQNEDGTSRPFVAETHLRVRYAETDAQGITHHTSYIIWFEVARGDYCRAIGYPYTRIEAENFGFVVTDLRVKYYYPAKFDDQIIVYSWLEKLGRASCVFGYRVYNETAQKICVEALSRHAAVTREGKPTRVSPELIALSQPLLGHAALKGLGEF
jgi:acyl-CoA thioester hydrolase